MAAELRRATTTLDRLRNDYEIVERSKFSRLRTLWFLCKSIIGLKTERDLFFSRSRFSGKSRSDADSLNFAPGYADVISAFGSRVRDRDLSDIPEVSIVIPVYNQLPVTMRCLRSIARTWFARTRVEIIVVDDCSTDETESTLLRVPGVTVIRNEQNQGFLRSCNRGAAAARGEFLVFLNNDTVVCDAWLERLLAAARIYPNVGAVGSKLIYPNGQLQEAGGIIWRNGDGWNYGRLENAQDPKYNFVRDVDYCSGASFLVRADAFRSVGGFNEVYAPAYYEDVDLCFALRRAGYRVLFEPRSEVVHYEGVSSGTDISSGTKRYQEINRHKFVERWADELALNLECKPANVYAAARRLQGGKSILFIDSHVPTHDRDAGSLRLFEIITILRRDGYRVVFLPDNLARIEPYTEELQALGVEVLYHAHGEETRDRMLEAFEHVDLAWISRPELFKKWSAWLSNYPEVSVLYDTVDLHHIRARREAELTNGQAKTWRSIEALELGCANAATATITVTEAEKATLHSAGIERVFVVPTIHNPKISAAREFEKTDGILFIGGYGHPPNVDAVIWLCNEIMPIVRRTLPAVRLTLLGNDPTPDVLALASNLVAVPGYIEDVDPYFLSHRIFVAPLRYGAGHKGKVGQSLSYGLPVVTTQVGAEGYNLQDGSDCLEAESASEFAQAIVRLYRDSELWSRISSNSIRALAPFTSQGVGRALRDVIEFSEPSGAFR